MNDATDMKLVRKIDAYVKGKLSEQEAEELWAELLQKPEYIDYLETELAVRDIIRKRAADSGADNTETVPGTIRSRWAWAAAVAAVLILLLMTYFFQSGELQPDPRSLALPSIEVQTEIAVPNVSRSGAQTEELTVGDSLLNAGYHALVSGDREKALGIFRSITGRFAGEISAAQAHLNIGILEYNAGNYKEAGEAFTASTDNAESTDFLRQKAYWFLGNTYLKLDRTEDSRRALEQAGSYEGVYLKPARRLLEQLSEEE